MRVLSSIVLLAAPFAAPDAQTLPDGFEAVPAVTGVPRPVDAVFAPDGTMFLATQLGHARVHTAAGLQVAPFVDLTDEVNFHGDRGLLGIALHPGFVADEGPSSWVYLLYTVSPVPGQDLAFDENQQYSFSRLTRYRATAGPEGITAVAASRQVLLGHQLPDGSVPDAIASLHESHSNGSLVFGTDGSLLIATGEGAHWDVSDVGGFDAPGFDDWTHPVTGLVGPTPAVQDSGSFRAQDLRSLSGKVLRIDPETGDGYPSNPFFDGDPTSNASRVWALGLRNPFRLALLPGTGAADPAAGDPGALVIGDVGHGTWEELDLCRGAENFRWPCIEGLDALSDFTGFAPTAPEFPNCNTPQDGTPTGPLLAWHHWNPGLTFPAGAFVDEAGAPLSGYIGACAIGGSAYSGGGYPDLYDGRVFCADFGLGWLHTIELDPALGLVAVRPFGEGFTTPVAIERHPITGDLYVVELLPGTVTQLRYFDPAGVEPYGCGTNPAGSLTLESPGAAIGAVATFLIDNPLGTQHPGSITALGISAQADPAFPCGTPLAGFGMAGYGALGELLIDTSAGSLTAPVHGHPWEGAPIPLNVEVPYLYSLIGREAFVQGLIFDPASADGSGPVFGLTNAFRIVIGS